jgi:hypothetical protein
VKRYSEEISIASQAAREREAGKTKHIHISEIKAKDFMGK